MLSGFDLFVPGVLPKATPLVTISIALSVAFALWRAWPRPIEAKYDSPSTRVRLIRGDLLEQPGHLVIGVCDTFDTAVPLIAPASVQGQFLEKIFKNDVAELDAHLEPLLEGRPFDIIVKQGKTKRYELGTVLSVRDHEIRYFLAAYSSMDENNEARATVDGLWKTLSNLWAVVRANSNGEPVYLPIIGGGQSKMSQILPSQDAIRLIVMSFMFASRVTPVCSELNIVALAKDYDELDHLELQAFLKSLRSS